MPWRDRCRDGCHNVRRIIAGCLTERLLTDIGGPGTHEGKDGKKKQRERTAKPRPGGGPPPTRRSTAAEGAGKETRRHSEHAVGTTDARPRRVENHRVATVTPKTRAVSPVPSPMTTPHNNTSCHTRVIASDSNSPAAMSRSAESAIRRMPNRLINAAANGAISPK